MTKWVNFNTSAKRSTDPKTAILMLNMGGPQCTSQVHEYLLRIMTDRDMIQLPVQSKLGPWIAQRRTQEVQKKYEEIGGGSPILKWTELQGALMCKELDRISPKTAPHKHYVGFRYVDPLTEDTLARIEKYVYLSANPVDNCLYLFYKKADEYLIPHKDFITIM